MSGGEQTGVTFPVSADGRRSTSALGRAVVADALGRVDPAGALEASREANWRAAIWRTSAGSSRPGWRRSRPRCRWPATGWRRCTGGCACAGPAARRPGSTRWSRRRAGTCWPRSRYRAPGRRRARAVGPLPRRAAERRAPCCAGWTRGSPRASSSRPARTPSGPSPRVPSGWPLPGRTVVVLGAGAEVGPAAGAAELGRPGDRGRPAAPGHLGPGTGNGAAQRRDPARPGRARQGEAPSPAGTSPGGRAST